jgi:hypothetical protein
MFLLKYLQNQLHKNKKRTIFITKLKPNFKFTVEAVVTTLKRIGEVDFLMKILATMSQLCTERSRKSEKWSNF